MSQATAQRAEGGVQLHVEQLRIEVIRGPDKGLVILTDSAAISIGTEENCVVALTDIAINSRHAVILNHDAGYMIKDLDSANGTWFGIQRITQALLTPPQRFRVGRSILRVELIDEDLEIEPTETNDFSGLFGESMAMRTLFAMLERHAHSQSDMLLSGELGTGKQRVSHALHLFSERKGPFITVDCGTGDLSGIHDQLFGDANGGKSAFELAQEGTVHLTAFGDLPYSFHENLLQILTDRQHSPTRSFRTRVVAAANADLRSLVAIGRFDAGLFYHLANIEVPLPALRDRHEDFVSIIQELNSTRQVTVDDALIKRLRKWRWPGNTGELKSVLQTIHPVGSRLTESGLLASLSLVDTANDADIHHALERRWAQNLLKRAKNNRPRAARLVGMPILLFTQLLRRLDLP